MESMTGHGRGNSASNGWRFTVECGSVNRKGIEIAVALPKPLSSLEPKVREEVQKNVTRGRINLTITLESPTASAATQSVVDRPAARRVLADLQELRSELALPGEISLELLLRSPGVLKNPAEEIPVAEELWPALQTALVQALDRMSTMRRKEGGTWLPTC